MVYTLPIVTDRDDTSFWHLDRLCLGILKSNLGGCWRVGPQDSLLPPTLSLASLHHHSFMWWQFPPNNPPAHHPLMLLARQFPCFSCCSRSLSSSGKGRRSSPGSFCEGKQSGASFPCYPGPPSSSGNVGLKNACILFIGITTGSVQGLSPPIACWSPPFPSLPHWHQVAEVSNDSAAAC